MRNRPYLLDGEAISRRLHSLILYTYICISRVPAQFAQYMKQHFGN